MEVVEEEEEDEVAVEVWSIFLTVSGELPWRDPGRVEEGKAMATKDRYC